MLNNHAGKYFVDPIMPAISKIANNKAIQAIQMRPCQQCH